MHAELCTQQDHRSSANWNSSSLQTGTGLSGVACKRRALLALSAALLSLSRLLPAYATDISPAKVRTDLTPNQAAYDANDENLRDAANLLQKALNAEDVKDEEAGWTALIEKYKGSSANWAPDVVGRAYGNRGNARSRQGKLDEALADYNRAIETCPWSVDPVLNRGVVLEALGRFEDAIRDYRAVLEAAPADPAAWNNLGNASAGLGRWQDAADFYGRAVTLAPAFSFAAANRALAVYQLGRTNDAMREMRSLLRRYPDFPDMRAALAAAEWELGRAGEAESNWSRLEDPRYKDREWLRVNRRWPPRLLADLDAFLEIRTAAKPASA